MRLRKVRATTAASSLVFATTAQCRRTTRLSDARNKRSSSRWPIERTSVSRSTLETGEIWAKGAGA